jgi:hypothetical protein
MEEEEKGKKFSNTEGVIQLPGSDVTPRKESPTTLTITPSKTLINSSNHNPGDYFDAELGNLTLKPIGHLQSLSANIFSENLYTLNELPFSPVKAGNSSADQVDIKLRSVRDILADVSPQRCDDLVFRTTPESPPLRGGLPGVESFDHAVASMKLLNLAAKLQNDMNDLSHEERKFCLEIASDWKTNRTQDTSKSEEGSFAERAVESAEKFLEMAKEGPKQEGFGCPVCPKSFNRLSALKYIHHSSIKPYSIDNIREN